MTDFYTLDDQGQVAALKQFSETALSHWSLEGSQLSLIKYRENAVFEVLTSEQKRYALRIHRYGYHSDEELDSELCWMKALQEADIDVPNVVPTVDGNLFVLLNAGDVPEPRQVDLFEWVNGEQLGSIEHSLNDVGQVRKTFEIIGQLAARVHNQAVQWKVPANFTRHRWDVDGLVGADPFWGRFWELDVLTDDQRELVLRARDRVEKDLSDYAEKYKDKPYFSLIHADLVAENLLVEGDTVRLIDFDDAGFGWHLFELATILYFEQGENYYEEAFSALINGYRMERNLSDEQLGYMPLFFLARSFTYLGWVHTRPETQTAKELAPMLVEKCCNLAHAYLTKR